MTQEDKQLLLKDLCARLPYRVIVHIKLNHNIHNPEYNSLLHGFMLNENVGISQLDGYTKFINLNEDEVKPYLHPMSSMTEEEKEEFRKLSDEVVGSYGPYHREFVAHCVRLGIKPGNPHECIDEYVDMDAIDFLNAHHFDYHGLIEKGLALEAPEDMYKTE